MKENFLRLKKSFYEQEKKSETIFVVESKMTATKKTRWRRQRECDTNLNFDSQNYISFFSGKITFFSREDEN